MQIVWKSYPLVVRPSVGRRLDGHTRESWTMAAGLGAPDDIKYRLWPNDRDMPTHSLPALVSGRAAARQGPDAFLAYHETLLRAFFEENRDVAKRRVLIAVAWETGLDVARFTRNLVDRGHRTAVLAELHEAMGRGITDIPTAIFADAQGAIRVVGEVTLDQYRRVVDWLLAT